MSPNSSPPVPAVDHVVVDELLGDGRVDADVVVHFPSPPFPAPPDFQLRVPRDWRAVPVAEAEMALRDPTAVDGFHPNVVVRVRRVAALDEVTDELLHSALHQPAGGGGLEIVDEEVRADLDTPARWLLVRFRGPDGRLLLARHLLVYVPTSEHVASIVTVVATFPAAVAAAVGPRMDAIVGSFRLAVPEPDGS
jgi:hypothetical protein